MLFCFPKVMDPLMFTVDSERLANHRRAGVQVLVKC